MNGHKKELFFDCDNGNTYKLKLLDADIKEMGKNTNAKTISKETRQKEYLKTQKEFWGIKNSPLTIK